MARLEDAPDEDTCAELEALLKNEGFCTVEGSCDSGADERGTWRERGTRDARDESTSSRALCNVSATRERRTVARVPFDF